MTPAYVVAAVPVDQMYRTQATPPLDAVIVEEGAGGLEEIAAALRGLHAKLDAPLIRLNAETAVLDLSGQFDVTAGGRRLLAVLSQQTGGRPAA